MASSEIGITRQSVVKSPSSGLRLWVRASCRVASVSCGAAVRSSAAPWPAPGRPFPVPGDARSRASAACRRPDASGGRSLAAGPRSRPPALTYPRFSSRLISSTVLWCFNCSRLRQLADGRRCAPGRPLMASSSWCCWGSIPAARTCSSLKCKKAPDLVAEVGQRAVFVQRSGPSSFISYHDIKAGRPAPPGCPAVRGNAIRRV